MIGLARHVSPSCLILLMCHFHVLFCHILHTHCSIVLSGPLNRAAFCVACRFAYKLTACCKIGCNFGMVFVAADDMVLLVRTVSVMCCLLSTCDDYTKECKAQKLVHAYVNGDSARDMSKRQNRKKAILLTITSPRYQCAAK